MLNEYDYIVCSVFQEIFSGIISDNKLLFFFPKAWETSRHALVEGFLLTATNNGSARYRTAFSHRFPHFEVRNHLIALMLSSVVFLDLQSPII